MAGPHDVHWHGGLLSLATAHLQGGARAAGGPVVGDRREGVALELVQDAADGKLALAQCQDEPPQLGDRAASLLLQCGSGNVSMVGMNRDGS